MLLHNSTTSSMGTKQQLS